MAQGGARRQEPKNTGCVTLVLKFGNVTRCHFFLLNKSITTKAKKTVFIILLRHDLPFHPRSRYFVQVTDDKLKDT